MGSKLHQELDEIVNGINLDVYYASQDRYLLEMLGDYVQIINACGLGKDFFANLQLILRDHLYLSIARLYDPYSPRNPGRSIAAAVHCICSHARELEIIDREPLFQFWIHEGKWCPALSMLQDDKLSVIVGQHLKDIMPQHRSDSPRRLDQALTHVKTIRDKVGAHNEMIDRASLGLPPWKELVDLIEFARHFVILIAGAYLHGSPNVHFEHDASRATASLRRLLERVGLTPASA